MIRKLSDDPLPAALEARRESLRRRLAAVRSSLRGQLLAASLAKILLVVGAFVAVSLVGDWWFRPGVAARVVIMTVALTALTLLVGRLMWRLLAARPGDLELAALLNRYFAGAGQRIANVLQLPDLLETEPSVSTAFVRGTVLAQSDELERHDFASLVDRRRTRRRGLIVLAAASLALLLAWFYPETAALWCRRWLMASDERWPQRTYLGMVGLEDGRALLAPRDESLLLKVTSEPPRSAYSGWWSIGGRGERLYIRVPGPLTSAVPERVVIRYRSGSGKTRQAVMTRFAATEFRFELPPIIEPVSVWIEGGDDWLGPITVEPTDRPAVAELMIEARRPGQERTQRFVPTETEGPLLFLKDTELKLTGRTNVPVQSATLRASEGTPPLLEQTDAEHFAARWTMQQSQVLEIQLVDVRAGLTSKPYFVSIGLLEDRPPRVSVQASGVGRRVTPQARIPLAVSVRDDLGLSDVAVELEQSLPGEEKKPVTKTRLQTSFAPPEKGAEQAATEFDDKLVVRLAEHSSGAGMSVKLRGTATDNCAEGAQMAASRWLLFDVVTPEELFYDILVRQRAERTKFATAVQLDKNLGLSLAKETVDPPALARTSQLVARQIWQVAGRLDATLEEMTLNELGGEKARELLRTGIIEPIRAVHEGPLARLSKEIDALRPLATPTLIKRTRETQAEVDAALAKILAQMAQWESFVDVLNQLREVIKLERSVLESTEQEKKQRKRSLFDD